MTLSYTSLNCFVRVPVWEHEIYLSAMTAFTNRNV